MSAAVELVPLGGLGEVGGNCLAVRQGNDIIVIDCGVTFPLGDYGVDVLHPRFDYLLERRELVRGIVITHGHEDHIGAVPFLLSELDAPVFAPRHAMSLMRHRLSEFDLDEDSLRLVVTRASEPFDVASFRIEPIRVTHSIADATALAIRTAAGLIVHTGDFKLDPSPADGELTDEARLRQLGDEGVRLLLSDSTNVDSPGEARSEAVVASSLEEALSESQGRVFVGLFASNVQRLIHLGRLAIASGRKICLLGRSMQTHVRVASEIDRLDWPSDLLVSPEAAAGLPRRELLVLATGTQAEAPAALRRLANGTHPRLRIEQGDTLVLSSRAIPGNERAVVEMVDTFLRAGIRVISRITNPSIHASGHAHRGEQRRMIDLVRPKAFIPVHGTLHHLLQHAAVAREANVGEILVIENGDIAALEADRLTKSEARAVVGKVATYDKQPMPTEVLKERAQLGRTGVVSVAGAISSSRTLVGSIAVRASGVVGPLEADILRSAERAGEKAIADDAKGRRTQAELEEDVRLAVRRAIEAETGAKPIVHVQLLHV